MRPFSSFKELVFNDLKDENQLNDIYVLVRVLCLIDIVFNFVLGGFFIYQMGNRLYQWSLAFILINGFVFWMTYWDKSSASNYIYSVVLIFTMVTYAVALGPSVGFQFSLYSLILLFFYRTDTSLLSKGFAAVFVSAVVTALWFLLEYIGLIVDLTREQNIILLITNTIFISLTIITISYFYYLKFASNEYKIRKYAQSLEKLATLDALTQLKNRRGITEHLDKFIRESNGDNVLSIAIADIDFFKKINDTYGHEAGDYVLSELSRIFRPFMLENGVVARWGGEEFLFVFEHKNGDYAYDQLTKLRHQVERKLFIYNDCSFHLTMTFGLEEHYPGTSISETIKIADDKLYKGKQSGRNVVIY